MTERLDHEQSPQFPSSNAAVVAPFIAYLLGTSLAGRFDGESYAMAYAVVVVAVAAMTIWLVRSSGLLRSDGSVQNPLLRFHWRVGWGVATGVVGIVLWIWLSGLRLEESLGQYLPEFLRPGPRVGFNPFDEFHGRFSQAIFVAFRMLGLAILVPWVEEIFWRGFLMRWIIDPDWHRVPLGEFTWRSSLAIVVLFTLAHPEWFAAAVYCTLINALFHWKRDLWLCVVAHAISNLLLGVYVLLYQAWWLW